MKGFNMGIFNKKPDSIGVMCERIERAERYILMDHLKERIEDIKCEVERRINIKIFDNEDIMIDTKYSYIKTDNSIIDLRLSIGYEMVDDLNLTKDDKKVYFIIKYNSGVKMDFIISGEIAALKVKDMLDKYYIEKNGKKEIDENILKSIEEEFEDLRKDI